MSYSWNTLKDAYSGNALKDTLEGLERKFSGKDETDFFASLVNTSVSKKQPYHRWLRYREGYAGDLVKELLRRYPISGSEFVLDPMCGSGSTLVACSQLEINSLGLDVNPYAILASKVKGSNFTLIELSQLRSLANNIVELAKSGRPNFNSYDNDIRKYFNDSNFNQLVSLKNAIKILCKDFQLYYDFLFLALLIVIESCSDRKKDGNGLATRLSKITNCFEEFLNQVGVMLEDFSKHPLPNENLSQAILTSAMYCNSDYIRESLNGHEVGSIIFSPPYANSFDYFESYKMELTFGEWFRTEEVREKRKSLIRSFRLSYKEDLRSDFPLVELLCNEIELKIPEKEARTNKRDNRTRLVPNMLRAYFSDMSEVINQGMSLIKENGCMHIVVDQSAYVGVAIPTDTILAYIADSLGYEVLEIVKCRRASTSAQQMKQYPYLKDLLRESIITIRKTNIL